MGSRLNPTTGGFTWAPGVGFVGKYDFVFVRWAGGRAVARHDVRIILAAKGSGHIGTQVVIDTPRAQQDVQQPFMLAGWAADLDAVSRHRHRHAARLGVSAGRRAAGVPGRCPLTVATVPTSPRCTATGSASQASA